MEIGCDVKNLHEHIDNLLSYVSSTPKQKPVEESASLITKLKDGLVKAKEIVQNISKKLCKSDELNGKERCELREMKIALQTGQIAFQFERDLAKYIYPPDKKFSPRKVFTNMKKWLEKKKGTEQGNKADERWKALKDEIDWSSEHEKVFFRLLEFRRTFAHPDIGSAQFPIPDEFSDEEKRCIKVLNDMTKRLQQ